MTLHTDNPVQKIAILGVLSALGAILMAFIQLPYPPVPFLRIEFSDVAVLLAFLLYGFKEAAFVGALKAVVNVLIFGPVGPIAIGQISAFIASMGYVLGLFVMLKFLANNHGVLRAGLIITEVTLLMTFVNYFFVTPIYFGAWTYLGVQDWLNLSSFGLSGTGTYLSTILIVYVPFNILKGAAVMGVYVVIAKAIQAYLNEDLNNAPV